LMHIRNIVFNKTFNRVCHPLQVYYDICKTKGEKRCTGHRKS
jgi:hypothetical protein